MTLIEEAVPLQPKPSAMEVEAKKNGVAVTELKDQQMDDDDGCKYRVCLCMNIFF